MQDSKIKYEIIALFPSIKGKVGDVIEMPDGLSELGKKHWVEAYDAFPKCFKRIEEEKIFSEKEILALMPHHIWQDVKVLDWFQITKARDTIQIENSNGLMYGQKYHFKYIVSGKGAKKFILETFSRWYNKTYAS